MELRLLGEGSTPSTSERKRYDTPDLKVYGSLRELTLGSLALCSADVSFGTQHPCYA